MTQQVKQNLKHRVTNTWFNADDSQTFVCNVLDGSDSYWVSHVRVGEDGEAEIEEPEDLPESHADYLISEFSEGDGV